MSETSRDFNFDSIDHLIAEALEENEVVMTELHLIPGRVGSVICKQTVKIDKP